MRGGGACWKSRSAPLVAGAAAWHELPAWTASGGEGGTRAARLSTGSEVS